MKLVGVNFSDRSIEAVELQHRVFQGKSFSAYSRVPLADGCIENGIILKPDQVTEQLKQLFAQAQPRPITTTTIILSLPEGQIFSRLLSFPKASSAEQIRQTVRDQLSRFIPFEPNEVAYDTMLLGQRGDKQDVLLVAAQQTVVQSYEAVARALGWSVKAIELESISSARAVLDTVPAQTAMLLLDIGARTSIASWFDQFGLRYSYNIPLAGQYFTDQVVTQLHCTPLEAEQRKVTEGFSGAVRQVLEASFGPIIKQLREGVAYVQSNYDLPTSAVLLLGGSAQLPGLSDFLSAQLHIPTSLAKLLPGIKKSVTVQSIERAGSIYYNAIGLALGGSGVSHDRPAINFLSKK
jgi:type IV pilus assembly protein PilM